MDIDNYITLQLMQKDKMSAAKELMEKIAENEMSKMN